MQRFTFFLTLLIALVGGSVHAADKEAATELKAQTHCPIRGGAINKDVYVDYEGQRIYFCCPGCDKAFLADAKAKLAEMKAKGIEVERLQATCPVSGEPIDKAVTVTHDGKTINLCCKKCVSTFEKDPEKYMKAVAAEQAAKAEKKTEAKSEKKAEGSHKKHEGSHNH